MNSDIAQILIVPRNGGGLGVTSNFEHINSNKYLLNESPDFKISPSSQALLNEQ
jgi:hypothetical protein